MLRLRILMFFLFYACCSFAAAGEEKHFVVVVCSYNNAQWYKRNLDSLCSQEYRNYHVMYIDDCSTDDTYKLVKNYIKEKGQEDRITLIHNEKRKGSQLPNFYTVIHGYCVDTDIVVICDGDDAFADSGVLSVLNGVYQDSKVWLTYGQFREVPNENIGFCHEYPAHVVANNEFRAYRKNAPSHLRSFYAGLFKKIKLDDLMYGDDFLPMAGDLATMLPMIEMASNYHFQFIPQVLYLWNASNPLSEHHVNTKLQQKIDIEIRGRPRYKAIESPFDQVAAEYQ